MSNSRSLLGKKGEDLACEHLRKMGYTILKTNYRGVSGEIDIVAEEAGSLAFIEVKTRRSLRLGHPLETITPRKQRQISKAALEYLSRCEAPVRSARFDVVSVFLCGGEARIEVIRNAFDLCYGS